MLYTVAACMLGWSPARCMQEGRVGVRVVPEFGTFFLSVFVYAQTEKSCERRPSRLERGCVMWKAVCVLMCANVYVVMKTA